jgi:hypothetical protein
MSIVVFESNLLIQRYAVFWVDFFRDGSTTLHRKSTTTLNDLGFPNITTARSP